jgi:hypothetical protein
MRKHRSAALTLGLLAVGACHGAAPDRATRSLGSSPPEASAGAASGAAATGAPAAGTGANRLGCARAILDAVPAEQERDTPRARLVRCAAAALGGSAAGGSTSSVVLRVGAAMVAAGAPHAGVALACDLGSPILLVGVAGEIAAQGSIAEGAQLAAAIDELREHRGAEPVGFPGGVGPQVLPPPPLDTSSLWARVAVRQAEAGDLAQADDSAKRAGPYGRARVDLAAYDWLRKAGKAAEATGRLDGLKDAVRGLGFNDPGVVIEVGVRLADAGRRAEAAALLREEHASTATGKWGAGSRAELAGGLARIGLVDEAVRLVRAGGSDENLAAVARQLIAVERLSEAEQVAGSLKDPYSEATVWTELGGRFQQTKDAARADQGFTRAEHATRRIALPRFRVEGLGALGEALGRAGRSAEADRVLGDALREARAITDADERRMSLDSLVGSLARSRRCAHALELCDEVGNDGYAIRDAAVLCANPADFDAIAKRLGDIKYPDHRAEALAALAPKLAERGQWPAALELVGRIEVAEQRALALTLMARLAPPPGGLPAIPGCEPAR